MAIYGNAVGGSTMPKNIVIECDDGTEVVGVVVDTEQVMTATPNDVRIGKTFAGSDGIMTGENTITYRIIQGARAITAGKTFSLPLIDFNQYDYTKFQCIIVKKNTTGSNSVESEKIVLNDQVFPVASKIKISDVTKNHETKSIELNISNDTAETQYIKYFTYKQED